MLQRFEYQTVVISSLGLDDLNNTINNAAKNGWELFQYEPHTKITHIPNRSLLIFKRPF